MWKRSGQAWGHSARWLKKPGRLLAWTFRRAAWLAEGLKASVWLIQVLVAVLCYLRGRG